MENLEDIRNAKLLELLERAVVALERASESLGTIAEEVYHIQIRLAG